RLDRLEQHIDNLNTRITDTSTAVSVLQLQQQQQAQTIDLESLSSPHLMQRQQTQKHIGAPLSPRSGLGYPDAHQTISIIDNDTQHTQRHSPTPNLSITSQPYHRKFSAATKLQDFEVGSEPSSDVVARGLISLEDAELYFQVFFQGCNHFVPVFISNVDTFASVRERSSMLFDSICAVGCRAQLGLSYLAFRLEERRIRLE
ncbi:hypothetical protein DH86_00002588, partial [Scytalidium sp. 3C]